ncbi:hypothetical protein [Cytobacillus firmus]|uniref:hypothetical protein n=1 Tax=Cytobacillus firmus TaxID=1399 RepID=UPI0018CE4D59|nr:hypothetical protein [Cytobacillus firmus]
MSCGSSGTGETPQARSVEEAHRAPGGSLSSLERKSLDNIVGENNYLYERDLN